MRPAELLAAMTRAVTLAAALLSVTASSASAGTYFGLGVGTSANWGGDLMTLSGDGQRSGRLVVGQRFGRFSIEATGTRFGLISDSGVPRDVTSLAAAAKLSFPLGNNFEAFGRAGLERTWLSSDRNPELIGNGWLLSGGFAYNIDAVLGGMAIFVDYTHTDTNLQDPNRRSVDGTAGMWTLGVTLAI
jgi:hypothetical protein